MCSQILSKKLILDNHLALILAIHTHPSSTAGTLEATYYREMIWMYLQISLKYSIIPKSKTSTPKEFDTMYWRHIAACREVDPELFFPIGNSGPALTQIAEAKQVCRECTVLDDCLRWALDSGQDAGVWGGMSEDERRKLKRQTLRQRARTGL